MGMDVMGMNPKNSDGDYFHANLWSWRPIHAICEVAIGTNSLDMDTEGWEYNDGNGLDTQERCDQLAEAIEAFLSTSLREMQHSDRFYLCLGMWCTSSGEFLSEEEIQELNKQHPEGTVLGGAVVSSSGILVEPSHSVSIGHVHNFVKFLRNCGGFEIY